MFRPRIIPCLLLADLGLVKTVRFADPTYVGDPINAVKIFNEARSDEIVFLDIRATQRGTGPNLKLIRKIGDEAFMPFAVGGGIWTMKDIREVILAGAEKVVINSACYSNVNLLREASEVYGSQAVVASVDVKNEGSGIWSLYSHGGTQREQADVLTHVQKLEEMGAGELFINSIDRDGTMGGYDSEIIKMICDRVRIPVIACGGASEIEDLSAVIEETGASAAAAGSLFVFIGSKRAVLINYPEPEELFELFESHG